MGAEIDKTEFTEADEVEFKKRLQEETKILKTWFDQEIFEQSDIPSVGLEVEAWLMDENALPAPLSSEFIEKLKDPEVVPEIAKFNFELNCTPQPCGPNMLNEFYKELTHRWNKCIKTSAQMNLSPVMIGSLPTVRDDMLTMEYISPQKRYYALNNRILEHRKQKPIHLNFKGVDELDIKKNCVLTEAAATSFQIHLQVNQQNAKRYYNSSVVLSSILVALGANSPYFYGNDLWHETRIPLFEQSVNLPGYRDLRGNDAKRVTMGAGYVRNSLMELFIENLDDYPILLPMVTEGDAGFMNHLRLHNGTIWRWTRPLIGLDKNGKPHLRIEQRVPASGPSMKDMLGNLTFFVSACHLLARDPNPVEEAISFQDAEKNFYAAARYGLDAEITWKHGQKRRISEIILDKLIPGIEAQNKENIEGVSISDDEFYEYIEQIIKPRVMGGQTGAAWQRAFVSTHGKDFQALTKAYYENQKTGQPVHTWKV